MGGGESEMSDAARLPEEPPREDTHPPVDKEAASKGGPTPEERKALLQEIVEINEELGLYDLDH